MEIKREFEQLPDDALDGVSGGYGTISLKPGETCECDLCHGTIENSAVRYKGGRICKACAKELGL